MEFLNWLNQDPSDLIANARTKMLPRRCLSIAVRASHRPQHRGLCSAPSYSLVANQLKRVRLELLPSVDAPKSCTTLPTHTIRTLHPLPLPIVPLARTLLGSTHFTGPPLAYLPSINSRIPP